MSGLRIFFGAVAFAAGIVSAEALRPPATAALAVGTAGLVCLMAAAALHLRHPPSGPGELLPYMRPMSVVLLTAGLTATGFCSLGIRIAALQDAVVPRYSGEKKVELIGRLANDPRRNEYSSHFILAVRRVEGKTVREKVAVSAYGPFPRMDLGDVVRVTASINALDETDDYDASLARRSIVAKASVSGPSMRRVGESANPALILANHFRSRIQAAARAGAEGRSGLLLALVIGDGRRVPPAVVDDFRAAGLSHLSAVSGQNVAMVMAPLLLVLTAIRLGRGARLVISLAVLALFVMVTRWEPSVLRAALMASAALSAWLFGRRPEALHLLGLGFFALLAIDPLLLWSIGFQLSFAATAGIIVLGPYLAARLGRPFSFEREKNGEAADEPKVTGSSGRLIQATAIGIAAQAAVLPLIALHFGRVSLVSLPANLLALPFVAPVTVLGLLGGVIGLVSIQAGAPFMFLAGVCVSALQTVARLFGRSELSQIAVDGWSLLHSAAFALALVAVGLWLNGKGRAARWPAVIGAFAAVMAGLLPAAGSTRPNGIRLTFFDVGQGDAALIQSADGARILVDGGPDAGYMAGRLRRMAISRLDLLVASHGHTDHVQGLGDVLRRFEVRTAVHPGIPTPAIEEMTAAAGIPASRFKPVSEDEMMRIGDLTVDFLGPAPVEREAVLATEPHGSDVEGSALNDASVVLRVSFAGECALFTGDLEIEGQEALLEAHRGEVDCTILKAPHHGSGRLVPAFVRAVDPEWVTVSVGRENDYGHPARKALRIFEGSGSRVLRTDRLGDIILNLQPDGRVTLGK